MGDPRNHGVQPHFGWIGVPEFQETSMCLSLCIHQIPCGRAVPTYQHLQHPATHSSRHHEKVQDVRHLISD